MSEDTGSKTNKTLHQNTGKSHFALIGAQDKVKKHPESDQIMELQNQHQSDQINLFSIENDLNQNKIKEKKRIETRFIHSPQQERLQGSSPSSNGFGSPFSLDDNIDILKDLRQQINCLTIIIKYTEEMIKINSTSQSIQFDLKTQVNLQNINYPLDKELLNERVQYTQKISRLQKLISDEDKQDNVNSPLSYKQNSDSMNIRSPKRNSILQNCEKFNWLNKQNNNSRRESSLQKGLSDFGDEESDCQSDQSQEILRLNMKTQDELLEQENSSQKSKNNIMSFKALNIDSKIQEQEFENAEEKDKGFYSDGDRVKND